MIHDVVIFGRTIKGENTNTREPLIRIYIYIYI